MMEFWIEKREGSRESQSLTSSKVPFDQAQKKWAKIDHFLRSMKTFKFFYVFLDK